MRLGGWKLPVSVLSPSSIGDAIVCPEMFRQKRLLKIPERNNLDRFIGNTFHATIEENFKFKMEHGSDLDMTDIKTAFQFEWDECIEKDGEPEWVEPPGKVGEKVVKMLDLFMTEVAPKVNPLKVETWFEETIPGVPVPLVGVIDLEDTSVIREFKTAKQKVAKPKTRWRFQGRVYQLFVDKPVSWCVTTKQVTPQIFTPLNAPDLLMPPRNPDSTVRLVQQTVEVLNDLYARYGKDEPWPTNGLFGDWTCDYCPAGPKNPNPTCPAWRIS